jgi:hypothetical protein
MSNIIAIGIKVLMLIGLAIVLGCMGNTYKAFDRLPEKDSLKSWLAVDLLVLAIVIVYLAIKIIS